MIQACPKCGKRHEVVLPRRVTEKIIYCACGSASPLFPTRCHHTQARLLLTRRNLCPAPPKGQREEPPRDMGLWWNAWQENLVAGAIRAPAPRRCIEEHRRQLESRRLAGSPGILRNVRILANGS